MMKEKLLKDTLITMLHLVMSTYWKDKITCNIEYESDKCIEYYGPGHPCDHISFCKKSNTLEKAIEVL